ncbi:hypothetical protein T310_9518 [Rasamsonia emersonii CBS 393.64]|uniref:Uncharacterized protein n=1 Tax=Rasamsonia emersonii (strain ATCC 16479 / CBS 393.64 / IMI 116815) TaxID=1408163 RepID=A0A0F4YFH1_RASE3|nr:hypothetical protein T310_9518 [Rasamsonia emersonii CBS 393.64]KKA16904.1 hypothetical protein T310_9518 [Rasamsonia emersonii CBS 393.64]
MPRRKVHHLAEDPIAPDETAHDGDIAEDDIARRQTEPVARERDQHTLAMVLQHVDAVLERCLALRQDDDGVEAHLAAVLLAVLRADLLDDALRRLDARWSVGVVDPVHPQAHLGCELQTQMAQSAATADDADALARVKSGFLERRVDGHASAHERRGVDGAHLVRQGGYLPAVDDGILAEPAVDADAIGADARAVDGVSSAVAVRTTLVQTLITLPTGMERATADANAIAEPESRCCCGRIGVLGQRDHRADILVGSDVRERDRIAGHLARGKHEIGVAVGSGVDADEQVVGRGEGWKGGVCGETVGGVVGVEELCFHCWGEGSR